MPGALGETAVLETFDGRVAGSDAERRAAVHLRDRLIVLGREADLQAIRIRPRFGLAHAVHALAGVAGSVLAVSAPAPGAALVLAAAVLTFLDVSGYAQILRLLLGSRASQNVESRERTDKPGLLILTAGYDSPRDSGALALATRVLRDPWLAATLAMLVILACCALRLAGIDSTAVTAVQFVPTVLLIVLVPAFVDVELSPAGADPAGAAAVATALRLTEELGDRLEHFDLCLLLTGANQPFALGMAAWLRRWRKQLDRERTAVVAIGPGGRGPVRYTRREGPLLSLRAHTDLVRLSGEVAEDVGDDDSVRAHVARESSNAARAMARGLPSITLSTQGREPADEDARDRLYVFTRELIERLDSEVGPSLQRVS